MQERLLQFIWKEKYYNSAELFTVAGERLFIHDGGTWNSHQGPDFLDARIRLDGTVWAGHIELHVRTSQWKQHQHDGDPRYANGILHVVWENDDLQLAEVMPTLELQPRVSALMLDRYNELMLQPPGIACGDRIAEIEISDRLAWQEDVLVMRLQRKAKTVLQLLKDAAGSWEECAWWWMARNFGGQVNAAFFEQVARSLPFRYMARHRDQVIQLEAILLGQAHLLETPNPDPYVQLLQREYRHLRSKYRLPEVHGQTQLLRMRPAAFPAVRLAQLAMLLHRLPHLHRRLVEIETIREMDQLLDLTANDFWHYHYTLEEPAPYQPKHIGEDMRTNLAINAIIPLVYALGWRQKQARLQQKAISWLKQLPAERNSIITGWNRLGVISASAAETQALTELRKNFCNVKRCLECKIGHHLLNR